MRRRTREIMGEWGLDIAPETPCRELSVEQLQVVEIARALARGARCVLLDEPTAALERQAITRLFDRVRQLTAAGVAVLYISHHLEEVFEICQDVAVLRDGELVLTAPTASLGKDDLVAAMVGGVAQAAPASAAAGTGTSAVPAADGAAGAAGRAGARRRRPRLRLGARPPVRRLAAGARRRGGRRHRAAERGRGHDRAGHRRRRGARRRRGPAARPPVPPGQRAAAQRAGIGYIPEDRRAEGFVAHLGVAENTTMTITRELSGRLGVLPPHRRAAAAAPLTARLSLVSSGPRRSRSPSCPAATSRRSPSRGRSRTARRSSSRSPPPGAWTSRRRSCCSARSPASPRPAARACCCAATSCPTWRSATGSWCWSAARSSPSSATRPSTATR